PFHKSYIEAIKRPRAALGGGISLLRKIIPKIYIKIFISLTSILQWSGEDWLL
ncbi:Hypothetical protein FKW44_014595, partial [Caligus rogercresseyi]